MPRITLFSASGGKTHLVPPQSALASASASASGPSSSKTDQESADESSDATEEVDELDSASNDEADTQQPQPQWDAISSPTSANIPGNASASERTKTKKRPKPATTRTPGTTMVPVNRVESIVQQDPQNGVVSKEAIYIIALATEEFIRHITRVSHSRATYDKRSLTTLNDFSDTSLYFEEYKFLKDMIPRPIPLSQAIEKRQEVVAKREALLSGADIEPLPPTMPSSKRFAPSAGASASARRKSRTKSTASGNGKSAGGKPRTVSAGSDVSNIRSERVRRRSKLVPDHHHEAEQAETQPDESVSANAPNGESMDVSSLPAPLKDPEPVMIKIKARSSATPVSAGTLTPPPTRGESILELDTPARTLKPPAPVLELGPRVEQDVFVLESGDSSKKRAPPSPNARSEERDSDGSLERKMEDARIDGERSGSESLEPRTSKKRPPSTSLEPSSVSAVQAQVNGGMGPPPAPTETEHLAKKRKKAEDGAAANSKPAWADKTTANGHSLEELASVPIPQPHEDFRDALRGSGRTIYSARKPV